MEYEGYNGIPDVVLVGCWAHARRKFDKALKAIPRTSEGSERSIKVFVIGRKN